MILWGRATSVNVQKVLWALDELGLQFEHRVVGGAYGGLDTPDFAALTPSRRVPVLQDGPATVWESHAILRHLARQSPDHPVALGNASQIDSWLDFGATSLQPAFIGLFYQRVRLTVDQRDAAVEQAHVSALADALRVLERGLADGRVHLAGPHFGMADIGLGALMYRLGDIAAEVFDPAPGVAAWARRLSARPAFARHIAVSYDALRPGAGL